MGRTTGRMVGAAMAAAVVGAGTLVAASPAQAATGDPKLLVGAVRAVDAGEPTWVQAYWTTGRDICDVEVTVSGAGVDVAYSADGAATYASFSRGETLARHTIDSTAFEVDAAAERTRVARLTLVMRYTELAGDTLVPWGDNDDVDCAGDEKSVTATAIMPVLG